MFPMRTTTVEVMADLREVPGDARVPESRTSMASLPTEMDSDEMRLSMCFLGATELG